tara:strand:+ start:301 stop:621 length:321 start_codon:yes stop_codon:yes gene_type:complete
MIPFIRSFTELMMITQSSDHLNKDTKKEELNKVNAENLKRKTGINPDITKTVDLPEIPKTKRKIWKKRREAVSRFFDELDYNNQIQPSYDLTLLESKNDYDKNDVA